MSRRTVLVVGDETQIADVLRQYQWPRSITSIRVANTQ